MKLKCPYCDYDGEFKTGKPPFFVFSLLDSHMEYRKAKRKCVCPECGTEIVFPKEIKKIEKES
jgi:hypothetical protein